MKIKLLTSRVGMNFNHPAGSIIEVDPDEAGRLIESQQAVAVDPLPVAKPVEEVQPVEVEKPKLIEFAPAIKNRPHFG